MLSNNHATLAVLRVSKTVTIPIFSHSKSEQFWKQNTYHFYNVIFFYRCGLPVCDEVCEKGHLHASYECPIFAKAFDNNEATENPDCGIFTSCGDYCSGAKK